MYLLFANVKFPQDAASHFRSSEFHALRTHTYSLSNSLLAATLHASPLVSYSAS